MEEGPVSLGDAAGPFSCIGAQMADWILIHLEDSQPIHIRAEAISQFGPRLGKDKGAWIISGGREHYIKETVAELHILLEIRGNDANPSR